MVTPFLLLKPPGVGRLFCATTPTVCLSPVMVHSITLVPTLATYSILTADAVEKVAELERGNGMVQRNCLGALAIRLVPLMYAQLTQTFAAGDRGQKARPLAGLPPGLCNTPFINVCVGRRASV